MSELQIRKMTALDILQVRKLPVQLAHPPSATLIPRKLRALMHDRNYRLVVAEHDKKVAAFAGLSFSPAVDSGISFLVVGWFAADRFAMSRGIAAELEAHATVLATENRSAGLLVGSENLSKTALGFYQRRGYALTGNTLIKALKR